MRTVGKRTRIKATGIFWRITITAVGAALIIICLTGPLLYFFGESADAAVTARRVGGSDDGRPYDERYYWTINYTFTDADGVAREGNTARRGGDTGIMTSRTVRYFIFTPAINALEDETTPGIGQLIGIALGVLLIVVMNVKKKKPRGRRSSAKPGDMPLPDDYDDSVEEYYQDGE